MTDTSGESQTTFKPALGLRDATMIVAGSMIGSGIFIVGADILRNVGSAGWLVAVWAITGFMTLTAAVSYGELSGMYPRAGGQYVYLKEAYGPLTAFLYGWSLFGVIQTGTIAAVGVAFSKFTAYFIPAVSEDLVLFNAGSFHVSAAQILSMAVIILLTFINARGVEGGKTIQTILTSVKIISLLGLIVFGLVLAKGDVWDANWSNAWQLRKMTAPGTFEDLTWVAALGAMAAAMVGSIFSSDAWNNVTFIAGEIKNPQRNIGLSLLLGTVLVSGIYILTNVMYTAVLPLSEIAFADKDRIAVAASTAIFGNVGTMIIALMIMVSAFGCANGMILSGARVYYTMAKDGLFFQRTGTLNRFAVPQVALWVQCIYTCLLCLSGRYGDLLDMVSFVVVIFYMLTIAGIFILRRKRPDIHRPYKAFGYPVLPLIYMVMGTAFCLMLITYRPEFTWRGVFIVLAGIPIYYGLLRKGRTDQEAV
ncbi:MAG: amino acid permease [Cyclobacteriaceae bacterium]